MVARNDYALLANRAYGNGAGTRTPLVNGWVEDIWLDNDSITGFSAGAYRRDSEIVISFAGTDERLKISVLPISRQV